jgi:hypothetical protein
VNILETKQFSVDTDVPTTVVMESTVSWDVMPCNPVKVR